MSQNPPNPYLAAETSSLVPGAALDAGCGAGAEAIWLATHGWAVTAVDISSNALRRAAERANEVSARVRWVEADLSVWEPGTGFDLVTTHYAHPAIPQLDFYERLASWVAPGGTLLVVGHLRTDPDADGATDGRHGHAAGHDHHPPAETAATAAAVTARLDDTTWAIVTASEHERILLGEGGREMTLHDVVVRATRRHP